MVDPPKITIYSKAEYKPKFVDNPYPVPGKTPNPNDSDRRYLLFAGDAFETLLRAIGWGILTEENEVEQGGVLLGTVEQYKNEIYSFVEDILLADTRGKSASVEFKPEMWADMQGRLTSINKDRNSADKLFITGWFHTHPKSIPVFMSGTDIRTQQLNFWQDWQASLVLNPHLQEYRAFFGEEAMEGKVVIIDGI